MTSEEREIERLMTVPPPKVELTKAERKQRLLMQVLGIVSVGAFAVASAALVVDASASCVNNVLSARNAPSSNDAAAHIRFAESVLAALDHPPTSLPDAAKVRAMLKAETRKYVNDLKADQDFRNAHPLGQC